MEPHTQHPLPAGPRQEQDSTPEEVSSQERETAQTVSNHRTIDRFSPTDDEGIMDYLSRKINNQLAECSIRDVNVYEHSPEELAGNNPSLGVDEWWFFSPRFRRSWKGTVPNRYARTGYWRSQDAGKEIYGQDGVCIGETKYLAFFEGTGSERKRTIWRMQEYVPDKHRQEPSGPTDMRLDDCVLCRIFKRPFRRPPKVQQQKITDDAAAAKSSKTENDTNQQEQNVITHPDQNDFDDQLEHNIITLPDQNFDDQQEQNTITDLPDQDFPDFDPDDWTGYFD